MKKWVFGFIAALVLIFGTGKSEAAGPGHDGLMYIAACNNGQAEVYILTDIYGPYGITFYWQNVGSMPLLDRTGRFLLTYPSPV